MCIPGSINDGKHVYIGPRDGIFVFYKSGNINYIKNISDIMVIPGITDDKWLSL